MIHIENLVKRYGDLVALNHLNLDIHEGEIFGLLGPNGSGKTTAINCLLSLFKKVEFWTAQDCWYFRSINGGALEL